eukprot:gene7492-1340_t
MPLLGGKRPRLQAAPPEPGFRVDEMHTSQSERLGARSIRHAVPCAPALSCRLPLAARAVFGVHPLMAFVTLNRRTARLRPCTTPAQETTFDEATQTETVRMDRDDQLKKYAKLYTDLGADHPSLRASRTPTLCRATPNSGLPTAAADFVTLVRLCRTLTAPGQLAAPPAGGAKIVYCCPVTLRLVKKKKPSILVITTTHVYICAIKKNKVRRCVPILDISESMPWVLRGLSSQILRRFLAIVFVVKDHKQHDILFLPNDRGYNNPILANINKLHKCLSPPDSPALLVRLVRLTADTLTSSDNYKLEKPKDYVLDNAPVPVFQVEVEKPAAKEVAHVAEMLPNPGNGTSAVPSHAAIPDLLFFCVYYASGTPQAPSPAPELPCPFEPCPFTSESAMVLDVHRKDCPERPVTCDDCCGATVPQKQLHNHVMICPQRKVNCPSCDEIYTEETLESHIPDCPQNQPEPELSQTTTVEPASEPVYESEPEPGSELVKAVYESPPPAPRVVPRYVPAPPVDIEELATCTTQLKNCLETKTRYEIQHQCLKIKLRDDKADLDLLFREKEAMEGEIYWTAAITFLLRSTINACASDRQHAALLLQEQQTKNKAEAETNLADVKKACEVLKQEIILMQDKKQDYLATQRTAEELRRQAEFQQRKQQQADLVEQLKKRLAYDQADLLQVQKSIKDAQEEEQQLENIVKATVSQATQHKCTVCHIRLHGQTEMRVRVGGGWMPVQDFKKMYDMTDALSMSPEQRDSRRRDLESATFNADTVNQMKRSDVKSYPYTAPVVVRKGGQVYLQDRPFLGGNKAELRRRARPSPTTTDTPSLPPSNTEM